MGPVLCMITPPSAAAGDDDALVARVAAAARAGVHLIQIRQPAREALGLIGLVRRAVAAVRGTPARVVVNDRVDVALVAGAHGVHLRGDSVSAPRVRPIVPPAFVIGRSVHSLEETRKAASAGSVDYLIFGTVFPTASKPGARAAGVGVLAAACQATTVPVLAVGGMRADRLGGVAGAGAAGIAAIGLFADPPIEGLADIVEGINSAFDTPRTLP